jgi:hypothetical protein
MELVLSTVPGCVCAHEPLARVSLPETLDGDPGQILRVSLSIEDISVMRKPIMELFGSSP